MPSFLETETRKDGFFPTLIDRMALQLRQGQVWRKGDDFIRIVRLERLEVGYKIGPNLTSGEGTHHQASKKDFCRLIKSATLLAPGQPAKPSPPPAAPVPPT